MKFKEGDDGGKCKRYKFLVENSLKWQLLFAGKAPTEGFALKTGAGPDGLSSLFQLSAAHSLEDSLFICKFPCAGGMFQ